MKQVYDEVRQQWVAAQPEELVRQRLLRWMIEDLGYPRGCLTVECSLDSLPHLREHRGILPDRRADILCLAKGIRPEWELFPLLLVECKAIPLGPAVERQVAGYNHYLGAPFVAIANQDRVLIAPEESGEYSFQEGLYPFTQLLEYLKARNLLC